MCTATTRIADIGKKHKMNMIKWLKLKKNQRKTGKSTGGLTTECIPLIVELAEQVVPQRPPGHRETTRPAYDGQLVATFDDLVASGKYHRFRVHCVIKRLLVCYKFI